MDYSAATLICLIIALMLPFGLPARPSKAYYGKKIGNLTSYAHGIKGVAYAVDENTIFIKGFSYDGTGPDAYFWVPTSTSASQRPSPDGMIVPYPEDYKGRDPPTLTAYSNQDVILRLPNNKKIRDIRWLSVWCRRFTVNFGDVMVPAGLEVPKARVLPEFKRLAHGLRSGNISILDAKTIYIPNLHYDGAGPDAYFWVGNGSEPTQYGMKVPNQVGSLEPLKGYQGEDIEIVLPGSLTVHDIDWLAMWCVQYRHNFGHVLIPKDLDVPPALGQTKITTSTSTPDGMDKSTNCRQLLGDRMQVQWEMSEDEQWVDIQLSARIREDQYMAFGISGEAGRSSMVGGDVVVAFKDSDTGNFRAVDYYMSATAQCDGKNGVCPDERIGGKNDVEFLSGQRNNGVTTIKYRRPLQSNEPINDRGIPMKGDVNVIAAIGPLNSRKEANAHAIPDKTMDDIRIDFSSMKDHSCTESLFNLPTEKEVEPWPPAVIHQETEFTARIGPTGGKRGYTPITGHPSWGIAWYINEKLIPEIYVERGKTYTFMVEGGKDPTQPARYHPFYITDSSEGGFGQKSLEEQKKQRIYAGVSYDGENYPLPTAAGRYCEYTHRTVDKSTETKTFEVYLTTLHLVCEEGQPEYLNWTVPMESPDLLYYQCYTHNNLGWKIHVVDSGYKYNASPRSDGSRLGASFTLLLLAVASLLR